MARELNLPRLLPIFVGLLLGVTVGSFPMLVPGLPVPVKLGLAAGPMIVAIVLARLGDREPDLVHAVPGEPVHAGAGDHAVSHRGRLAGGAGCSLRSCSAQGLQLLLLGRWSRWCR